MWAFINFIYLVDLDDQRFRRLSARGYFPMIAVSDGRGWALAAHVGQDANAQLDKNVTNTRKLNAKPQRWRSFGRSEARNVAKSTALDT